MRLHHYTDHWAEIDADGVIRTGWPPHSIVHFSVNDDPITLTFGLRDRRYRITAEIPDCEAHPWIPWARAHLRPEEVGPLTAAGRGAVPAPNDPPPAHPDEWYVVERSIPRAEWLWAVRFDPDRGVLLWSNPRPPPC